MSALYSLPVTKSEKKGEFLWEPYAGPDADTSPVAGTLLIAGARCNRLSCRYAVAEHPSDFDGRAFVLAKMDKGSDCKEGHYHCFVGKRGERICDCKGFDSTGNCKHIVSLVTLIEQGKI